MGRRPTIKIGSGDATVLRPKSREELLREGNSLNLKQIAEELGWDYQSCYGVMRDTNIRKIFGGSQSKLAADLRFPVEAMPYFRMLHRSWTARAISPRLLKDYAKRIVATGNTLLDFEPGDDAATMLVDILKSTQYNPPATIANTNDGEPSSNEVIVDMVVAKLLQAIIPILEGQSAAITQRIITELAESNLIIRSDEYEPPSFPNRLLTATQAGALLGCPPASVPKYVKPIPGRKATYRWRDVNDYIEGVRMSAHEEDENSSVLGDEPRMNPVSS